MGGGGGGGKDGGRDGGELILSINFISAEDSEPILSDLCLWNNTSTSGLGDRASASAAGEASPASITLGASDTALTSRGSSHRALLRREPSTISSQTAETYCAVAPRRIKVSGVKPSVRRLRITSMYWRASESVMTEAVSAIRFWAGGTIRGSPGGAEATGPGESLATLSARPLPLSSRSCSTRDTVRIPDPLEDAMETLLPLMSGKLGCAGDRDLDFFLGGRGGGGEDSSSSEISPSSFSLLAGRLDVPEKEDPGRMERLGGIGDLAVGECVEVDGMDGRGAGRMPGEASFEVAMGTGLLRPPCRGPVTGGVDSPEI